MGRRTLRSRRRIAGCSGVGSVRATGIVAAVSVVRKGKCEVCGASSGAYCVVCCKTFYCGRAHQVVHWSQHKKNCYPMEEGELLGYLAPMGNGPYMKATRDIKVMETLFEEPPIMTGPGICGDTPFEPLCLGCMAPTAFLCPKCNWPVCSEICQNNKLHLEYECPIFEKRKVHQLFDSFQYELIRVLRCLLLKEKDPKKFEILMKLEAIPEKRQAIASLSAATKTACIFVNMNCGLKQFDRETIDHICGVVDLHSIVTGDYRSAFQIYTMPSKLIHDCKANVKVTETVKPNGQHTLRIVAIQPIQKGEFLSFRAVLNMQPAHERQRFLWTYYYFQCKCSACVDPTEGKTFFSAVKCPSCKKNITADDYRTGNRHLLPEKPYDLNAPWRCKTCKKAVNSDEILDMFHEWDNEFFEFRMEIFDRPVTEKIGLLKGKIKEWEEKLHPGNFLIWRVKQIMVGIMSHQMQIMSHPGTWKEVERMYKEIQSINESINFAVDALQPGMTLSRGRSLYDIISSKWSYIQWGIIFGKADSFRQHPQAVEFFELVAEFFAIFMGETGNAIKFIADDVIYMKNNLNAITNRIREERSLEFSRKLPIADDDKENKTESEN